MNNPYNDSHALRHEEVCGLYGLDPHVHNIKEAEDAPRTRYYGWPEAERYPLDTPERTKLSWAYANEDTEGAVREKVLANIKKAADFWKIELPERKTASDNQAKHIIVITGQDFEDEYRINNPAELKSIVDHVRKHASDFSYKSRLQFASGVSRAPRELQKLLSDEDIEWTRRVKGEILTDGASVKKACDRRAVYLEQAGYPDVGETFRGLANKIKDDDVVEVSLIRKIASAMDLADRTYGLSGMYGSGLDYPELSIDGFTPEHVKKAYDSMIETSIGTTSAGKLANNRGKIDDFFLKIAGEDTTGLTIPQLAERLSKMDRVETDAFKDIVGDVLK